MEEKIYCKDLKKEINTQTCHSHRKTLTGVVKKTEGNQREEAREKTQICKKCPFNKSYPLMEKPQMWYDKMAPLLFEIDREEYERDQNPISLIHAFIEAVKFKLDIPSWVINKLDEVFQEYLYGTFKKEKDRSLDRLLGCIGGKGQDPVRERLARRDRDLQLMTDIGMLIQRGIGPKDAVKVVYKYNQGDYSPNPEKLRQTYHNRWQKQLEKVVDYGEPERIKDLLKSAPEEIKNKKKYLKIFGVVSENNS